jgi:uncharacterized protein (DUF2267 family)
VELEELLERVRDGSATTTREEAERAVLAVLQVVGAHLSDGAARELAEVLPEPAAGALRHPGDRVAHAGTGPELYAQVARRRGVSEAAAADEVVGVLRAVASGVDQERLDRVRAQLPADVARMLAREDEGDTSALHTGA